MSDDLPRLRVIGVGHHVISRFVVADQFGRLWSGRRFEVSRAKARLYQSRNEAVSVAHDFVRQHYEDKPMTRFQTSVIVEVWSDNPVSVDDVSNWCSRAICLTLDARAHGNGPDGALILPTINWKSLHKEKPHE